MCGIVGYSGKRPVIDLLLKGLACLEYRGYDSAGVAYFVGNRIEVKKAEGKLENVAKFFSPDKGDHSQSRSGIGHTRWATHGKPTTQNAHPHQTGHVVLVHNGIIENYQEIKTELHARGHRPKSETDSELFGFLVLEKMDAGLSLKEAVRQSFLLLKGSCSVVVMSEKEPGVVIGVRNGTPMVAARDPEGGILIASDAHPILEYTKKVYFLENGDMVVGSEKEFEILDYATGKRIERLETVIDWTAEKMDKQGFPHYMLKEIHEQPVALVDTLNGILDRADGKSFRLADHVNSPGGNGVSLLREAQEMTFIACGTSWHAALLGKYWIEQFARIPVHVELASEFRYRNPVLSKKNLVVGITQSGETADTLAVIRDLKSKGIPTAAITNVRGSSITREANATFYTAAGPEIGVAATKTFLSQLMVLVLWAGALGKMKKAVSETEIEDLFQEILKLPHFLKDALDLSSEMAKAVKKAAIELQDVKGFFFIGRGYSFPIALEGALKLKEIAYVHAEGYAAGELKHGPIAMIDQGMAVVVLAPRDSWRDKTISNLEEVKARGARIVGIGEAKDTNLKGLSEHWIPLPITLNEALIPFILSPVIQWLSYEIAVLKGTDVDKPRNLAKSVTVE